ncbi:hypothetical protein F5B18DRAFT_641635 [Nemania serpens]|nr:hypothetical protein F5B18DRAFT_641635 [Nemania serpens]
MHCEEQQIDIRSYDGPEDTQSQSESDHDEFRHSFAENAETLVYLGFSESRAEEVAAHATRLRNEFPQMEDSWLKIAIDNAVHDGVADIGPETEDWWPLFEQLGLSVKLYNSIMHPEYSQIRKTETAKYWIRDTMEIRYGHLLMIQECAGKRGTKRQASNVESHSDQGSKASKGKQPRKRLADLASLHPSTPSIATVEPNEPAPEGYVALWKGLARNRIKYWPNGEIRLSSLWTQSPSDFVGVDDEGPALYFAEDRAVRVQYAGFAKQRLEQSSPQVAYQRVVLLRILVKKSWIEGIRQFVVGDDWKKVIFLCRRGRALRASSRDRSSQELGVDWYADAKLLIGHVSQGVARTYEVMESWSSVTAEHVMTVPPANRRKAIQWVFKGMDTLAQLEQNSTVAIDAQFERSQN